MTDHQTIETRLRAVCLALPEARETQSFGHPNWRVGKKTFACFEPYGGEWVINFKTTPVEQDRLVSEGERYFIAPYTGRYGWVCRRLTDLSWPEVEQQITDSYRLVAPKTLARRVALENERE